MGIMSLAEGLPVYKLLFHGFKPVAMEKNTFCSIRHIFLNHGLKGLHGLHREGRGERVMITAGFIAVGFNPW